MEIPKKDIEYFKEALKKASNYDFSDYSEKSFGRRIEKLLSDHQLDLFTMVNRISNDEEFLEQIVKEITVNTTELFRDPAIWQLLKQIIEKKYKDLDEIKIWHAGCSTGQEVYSMLILLYELGLFEKVTIYGTDLNDDVLKVAESGKYKYRDISEYIDNYRQAIEVDPLNPDTETSIPYSKYLEINKAKDTVRVKPFLTKKAIFIKHDLVTEGNIFNTKFHIIMCRNVLIYFNHTLQNKLFEFFYDNLYEDGSLVIGRHEGILGTIAAKFKKKETIYIKKPEELL
jgi:chemotaxis protein methyltransferase CheR